ncbi:hypothetical protein [Diaphorobacter aerolatus]|uniref:Uncharacterized protein n=1 Tax=Diaphorobacter aerolatus TaxID=1288495 RepID=A0A7H0GMA0_9BURK|nr:hypothetical protein [Diaphorobacter aerolatus]QNP49416.1 hypothetical protein H9K75_05100 [Diaphorobacter aerolatus]
MKTLFAAALIALAPALVTAQTTSKPAPKTAAKAPAAKKTTTAAKKSTPKKSAATSSRTQLKSAATQVATGFIAAEAALSPAELALAETVTTGRMPCELGAFVDIEKDEKSPGRFHVTGKNFKYHMQPVTTSTGAVRLEDQKAGAVWMQIANKSMLLNQKQGQRMADECMSPNQVAVAESMKKNPQPNLLDGVNNK